MPDVRIVNDTIMIAERTSRLPTVVRPMSATAASAGRKINAKTVAMTRRTARGVPGFAALFAQLLRFAASPARMLRA